MLAGNSVYEIQRDAVGMPEIWRSDNNSCPPHFHSLVEIVCVLDGTVHATLDGKTFEVNKGEVMVVSSYIIHRYETREYSDSYVLLVPANFIQAFHEVTRKRRFAQSVLPAGRTARQIARYLKDLNRETLQNGTDNFVARGLVYAILGLLMDNLPMEDIPHGADHDRVRQVLGYLHGHYTQPLSLDEMANIFGYSRSRFSHIFNRDVGCSLPEYVNMLRAQKAARLLRDGGMSVTDAAMAAGFESVRTFYRAFNSHFGLSPVQYLQGQTGGGAASALI